MIRGTGRSVALVVLLIVAAVTVAAVALALAGYGSTGITAPRLDKSIGRAFSNLYARYQIDEGYAPASTASTNAEAVCYKGAPNSLQSGAGNDWVCTITYAYVPLIEPFDATYNVTVQTNGCYAADGDGPTSLNVSRTIVGARGRRLLNPLWVIDGCFDTT
jgi:hypothetical protein